MSKVLVPPGVSTLRITLSGALKVSSCSTWVLLGSKIIFFWLSFTLNFPLARMNTFFTCWSEEQLASKKQAKGRLIIIFFIKNQIKNPGKIARDASKRIFFRAGLFPGFIEMLVHFFPIDHIPECIQVFGSFVLVFEIVCVFPNIHSKHRLAFCFCNIHQRIVLVGS